MSRTIRTRPDLRSLCLVLLASAAPWLAGCSGSSGGFSGRYQASEMGDMVTLDFRNGNQVNVWLGPPDGKDSLVHHCIYTIAEGKMVITTDEPMGVPMHLSVAGDTLTDGSVVYRKK